MILTPQWIAKNIYDKMKDTGGLPGDKGPTGPIGDIGEPSVFLRSKSEIAFKNVLKNINETIEKHMFVRSSSFRWFSVVREAALAAEWINRLR